MRNSRIASVPAPWALPLVCNACKCMGPRCLLLHADLMLSCSCECCRLRRWPSVQTLAQKAFQWRLRMMPYHCTAFYDAHTIGCPVMRPTFFNFPGDPQAYSLDQQWMLGDALLVRVLPLVLFDNLST